MTSSYPDDVQFAGLVEAATAAADAHQRDLGKRKRGENSAYTSVSNDGIFQDGQSPPTLANSAAVLFREPSEKSKKYSRPPLGKVFTSLELAPESFLRLQHAAKSYMLDDNHPERREVVGHKKHSGNNDVAKLKLWQCVDDFLRADSVGDKFFGHTAGLGIPDAPQRTFFWPEDHHRIIKLLMPLLRKMVTNERQRLYAAETRRHEPRQEGALSDVGDVPDADQDLIDTTVPEIDPSLQRKTGPVSNQNPATLNNGMPYQVTLRVNVISCESGSAKRVIPEFVIPSHDASSLASLLDRVQEHYNVASDGTKVKAWLPEGLVQMHEDGEWVMSQISAGLHEWMDGQLKVLVEI